MELILSLIKPFLGEAIVVLGIIGAFIAAYLRGKNAGKKQELDKQERASYENERKRTTVEDRVRNATDDERERLRKPWYRD